MLPALLGRSRTGEQIERVFSVSSPYHDLVLTYAWSRLDLDEGLGLVYLDSGHLIRVEGREVVVDGGDAWAVTFRVELDRGWRTRLAHMAVVEDGGERYRQGAGREWSQ